MGKLTVYRRWHERRRAKTAILKSNANFALKVNREDLTTLVWSAYLLGCLAILLSFCSVAGLSVAGSSRASMDTLALHTVSSCPVVLFYMSLRIQKKSVSCQWCTGQVTQCACTHSLSHSLSHSSSICVSFIVNCCKSYRRPRTGRCKDSWWCHHVRRTL